MIHVVHHVVAEEPGVDVYADRIDQAVVGSKDRDRGALELTGPDVELVIDLVLAALTTRLEIKHEVGGAGANRPAGHVGVLDRYQ